MRLVTIDSGPGRDPGMPARMIENASDFVPAPAPAYGALGGAAALPFPREEMKSGPGAEAGTRRLPIDVIQLSASAARKSGAGTEGLTKEEKAVVADLKRRDAETRRHEQAHANTGGPYAGTPSYTFERGPDGRSYAVAGTTPIDVTPVSGDAAATLRKMEMVKRAALAPAEPSAQDRKVAAQADAEIRAAQAEATAESTSELRDETGPRQIGAVAHPGEPPMEPQSEPQREPKFTGYGGSGAGAGQRPNVSALLDVIA